MTRVPGTLPVLCLLGLVFRNLPSSKVLKPLLASRPPTASLSPHLAISGSGVLYHAENKAGSRRDPGPNSQFLAVQLPTSYTTSLSLSFHIWKMGGFLPV